VAFTELSSQPKAGIQVEALLVESRGMVRKLKISVALLTAGLTAALLYIVFSSPASDSLAPNQPPVSKARDQHIFIVRHGDKYSSYPPCPSAPLCFNSSLMGNNPPLTPCGMQQAEETARHLAAASDISHIVSSPFLRTIETALPLAKLLNLSLNVEYLESEARQDDGPFRPFNLELGNEHTKYLLDAQARWDLDYGSFPVPTPEGNREYCSRVKTAAGSLRHRFPVGNLAVYTHATTSFSLAYGVCYGENGDDAKLQEFVEGQDAIGPGGVILVIIKAGTGECSISQTQNIANMSCGATKPYKCPFAHFPAWYWTHSAGVGPGKCH